MKLIKTETSRFRLITDQYTFEDDLESVREHMIATLGMDPEELDFALDTIKVTGMDTANFSSIVSRLKAGGSGNYTFICCSRSTEVRTLRAELEAIQDLRMTLGKAMQINPNGLAARRAGEQLLSLYAALNVQGLLRALEMQSQKSVA